MISREGRTFRVHPMVQEVLRIRIPGKRQRSWIEKSINLVNQYSPENFDDLPDWKVTDLLRSHTTELIQHGQSYASRPIAELMSGLAGLLYGKGLYEQAEPLMRRAIAIKETSLGPQHSSVARDLSKLAELLQDMNRLSEAEPLMRRALAIDEHSFGKEHPTFAIRLNNLALMLQHTHRLPEAGPLMWQALEISERTLGADHASTQIVRRNLEILLSEIADERDRPEAGPDGAASEEPEA